MADRGRRAQPIGSLILEERWQSHCTSLHKQRLKEVRASIDMEEPQSWRRQRSGNPKRAQMLHARQLEVNLANRALLERLIRIRETDTTALFRPWLARSTFQTTGVYCDPVTGLKCVDHINSSCMSSPRSIHYTGARPGSALSPTFEARSQHAYMQTLHENSKLLSAISGIKSTYNVQAMEVQHARDRLRVSSLSTFRGPESARYRPSSSLPASPRIHAGSAYLPEGWHRANLQHTAMHLSSARTQPGGVPSSRAGRGSSMPEDGHSHCPASSARESSVCSPRATVAGAVQRGRSSLMAATHMAADAGEQTDEEYDEHVDDDELESLPLNYSNGSDNARQVLSAHRLDLGTIHRQGKTVADAAAADKDFDALVDGVVEDGGSR